MCSESDKNYKIAWKTAYNLTLFCEVYRSNKRLEGKSFAVGKANEPWLKLLQHYKRLIVLLCKKPW